MFMLVPGRRGKGKMNRGLTLPVLKYLHPVDGQTDRHTERNQPQ